ncbi:MAG TPA: valine--tRNA ligase [Treponemataceae bacterium]|jgi:valyl-tRNA synthetase|nr:valine--tRNA ligase [Treponemataceae bacterium]
MKGIELEKAYNPQDFEDRLYEAWEMQGYFKPKTDADSPVHELTDKTPFTVVIPPPNVTGVLHMGHGLNNTLQDIVVRYHRMNGEPALWVPGTDHAGIATQNVVERRLKKEGLSRRDLGREKFLERTWAVKDEHHAIITKQLKKIGASVDWNRERFTMDEGLSKAVRDVFVTLYERGLVYRGNYLVNWCTSCGTALADDEVDHSDVNGAMYHIYYEIDGGESIPAITLEDGTVFSGGKRIEIATTRPETLLGDTAVAVHPEDPRYKDLIGKRVKLPLTGKTIPVVADTYVERAFGTGIVKITPAHDPNDWEVAKRHNLPVINILNPDGTLNEEVPEKYRGMKCSDARKAVIADLTELGLYKEEETISHSVGHCYRCNTVVEPYLSDQWFVKMKPLAEKALKAWKDGDIVFYPKKWENTYSHWMENIRDWCISRQLWWGHRIPVWYCQSCGEMIVSREDPENCPKCKASKDLLKQDPDVLDTWFSSWLWPFSTLGWPENAEHGFTEDFNRFYPTSALVTAYDIIFFWVSRMIMAGLEFTGKAPFKDIYIHGLVRDKQGKKMSKSLGNGLDPLEITNEFGSDAMKFTLGFLCAQGQDILVDKESFKLGSRFANKIWNASRYLLGNLEGRNLVPITDADLTELDMWIYSCLDRASRNARSALEGYRYNEGAQALYEYFWNDFCDWYVEATKLSFRNGTDEEKDRAVSVLMNILEESLRLLHPYLPFVTEEIYQKLPLKEIAQNRAKAASANSCIKGNPSSITSASEYTGMLIAAPYPAANENRINETVSNRFAVLQELIRSIRALRAECGISPDLKIDIALLLTPDAHSQVCREKEELIMLLSGVKTLSFISAKPQGAIGTVGTGFEAFLLASEGIDSAQLKARFQKEIANESAFIQKVESKLSGKFAENAPAEVVEAEKEKLKAAQRRVEKLNSYIENL